MLTREENELLTRVGPGTPAGDLLRRYWHPVAIAQELSAEHPTRFVRILGEDLVLFRDTQGRVGLLADRCAHRGVSLCYGRVEERGISCAYHGWLYDTAGEILETPPERNDAILRTVKQPSYPVRKYVGMYWAYLGPLPAPQLPPLDTFLRKDGKRHILVHPRLDCNWLQAMENSVDPDHLQILHQEFIERGREPVNTTRGFIDDVKESEFYVTDFAIMKKRTYMDGRIDEHPVVFPNILRQGYTTQIRTPMDDTHVWHVHVFFKPTGEETDWDPYTGDVACEYLEPYKEPAGARHPEAHYTQRSVLAQDHMAWETQGPIADRTTEHLSYSDRGVSLLRKIVHEQIERAQRGEDPMGVVRDPNHPMIDTNVDESIKVEGHGNPQADRLDANGNLVPVVASL